MIRQPASSIPYYGYLLIFSLASLPPSRHDTWPMLLLIILVLLTGALHVGLCLGSRTPVTTSIKPYSVPLLLLSCVSLWALFQSLPLPLSLSQALSPFSAESRAFAAAERNPISLAPGDTAILALFSFTLLVFFFLTVSLHQDPERIRLTLLVLVICGTVQALYGSFMVLSGLEYGFFAEKTAYRNVATGTFYNRNHLAGFLEMCLACGIGLLVSTLGQGNSSTWRARLRAGLDALLGPKMRLRVFLAFMVIALVLTRSRMGNTAFFSALIICSGLYMLAERKINWGAIILFASLMLVDFLIVGQWFGFDELAERLESTSVETESRDEVVEDTMVMLSASSWTGFGLGSFYTTYRVFQRLEINGYYDHAHNDFVEFTIELGFIGMIPLALLVVASVWMGVVSMFRRRNRLAKGLGFASTMGIITLMIHSLVDFNLQITANSLMFVFILSLGWIAFNLQRKEG